MSQTPSPPITTADRLQAYLACELAILSGHQSYTIEGVGTFTRANLRDVQAEISRLRLLMSSQAGRTLGGITTTQVVF